MPAHVSLSRALLSGLLVPVLSLAACAGDQSFAPADQSAAAAVEQDDLDAPATPEIAPAVGGIGSVTTTPRIAFLSTRFNFHPNVFTMTPSGGGVVRLTGWTDNARSLSWSKDNKVMAVSRSRYNPAVNNWHDDIFLMDADGSNQHWARSAPSSFDIQDPAWSPDGVHIVVSVVMAGGPYLALLNVTTGGMLFVAPGTGPVGRYGSYDPTGKKIVYVGKDARSLERINADGTGHVTLYQSTTVQYGPARYSADGKRLAFSRTVSGDYELYVKNYADGTLKRLTTSKGYDSDPIWSPDGTRIAFASSRTGGGDVYSISSNGGTATRLTTWSDVDGSPAYSH